MSNRGFHGNRVQYVQREVALDPLKLARDRNWIVKIDESQARGLFNLENAEIVVSKKYEAERLTKGKPKPPKIKEIAAATVLSVHPNGTRAFDFEVLMCATKSASHGGEEVTGKTILTVRQDDLEPNWQARISFSEMRQSDFNDAFVCMVYHLGKEADLRVRKHVHLGDASMPRTPREERNER